MQASEIRQTFLKFFESKGHTIVASSPVVPGDDPTLLFTNAGMNQFKDVFLGFDKRSYQRATTSQKCIRAGGKHNDLENVGYTARHHTFFEMLGNFSFGDYFKKDAIAFAWELLTEVYKLPKDKLWVTVYAEDDEAYEIWNKGVGVPAERIVRIGDNKGARYASDNFWMMGDTGPCGPCTEIFYDHGADIPGGPPGSPNEDGDRYIEIWNNVFMQFNRDEAGTMHPLPKPSVDTGMGLERISAVMQHVHSNYDIDLFQALIAAAARETQTADLANNSLKVIADHIRACSFLIVDGIIPGNEGRGYVLRRIMRRAIRHGYKLGLSEAFFYKLVAPLAAEMGEAFPQLKAQQATIEKTIRQEEDSFATTLDKGMKLLEDAIGKLKDDVIPGEVVFKLYDTYGFPLDLTADIARERNLKLDEGGYEREMQAQRTRARAASQFKSGEALRYEGAATQFVGYDGLSIEGANVLALYRDGAAVQALAAGDAGVVVLDQTPFYAEGGGQIGDAGHLGGFKVADTQKITGGAFGHSGSLESGTLKVGDTLTATVESSVRRATMRNHSATHLLHAALRQVLGTHVSQKGSLVNTERTRFDFSHGQAVTADEIAEIERLVNAEVLANHEVGAKVMSFDDAVASGAMALFGEKYGAEVRVLKMGSFSTELCGGTHVTRTGDIGLFKIFSEGGVAAGVRRIEAVTGENALSFVSELQGKLNTAAAALKTSPADLGSKIGGLLETNKALEKELATLKAKLAAGQGDELLAKAVTIHGVKLLAAQVDGDANGLRTLHDQLKQKLGSGILLLGCSNDGKASLIAGVTADLTGKVKAGELVNFVAGQVGGKGGGRPDMAQAGGTQPENLPSAIASVVAWVEAKL